MIEFGVGEMRREACLEGCSYVSGQTGTIKKTSFPPSLLCFVVAIAFSRLWWGDSRAQGPGYALQWCLRAGPADVFANPPMLSSQNGRLDVDLTAAPATYAIDGINSRACSTMMLTCRRSGASVLAIR